MALSQIIFGSFGVVLPWCVLAQENLEKLGEKPVKVAQASPSLSEQFNTAFFHGAAPYVDLKSLLSGSSVAEGTYFVDLYVNELHSSRSYVRFAHNDETGLVEPCFTLDLLRQVGVNMEKLDEQTRATESSCLRIAQLIEHASADYDSARLRLNINVPQAYMSAAKRGYVDASLWSEGVPVAFANYNFNTSRTSVPYATGTQNFSSLNLNAGANWGMWRLRNNSSVSSGSGSATQWQSQNTYVQRDLTDLKSQMWLGDTYTSSQLFDSVRFRGVQLASDEGMRPDSEQGYAPVIRGTAESNATIEVRQNGFLLYSANVAPGPFEITDLRPSGSNGNLEVTVIEADGRRNTTIQAFSSPPLMVREGRVKYDATVGQLRQQRGDAYRPTFASGSALYGLTSNLTVAGGFQASSGYQVLAGGFGLNTKAGAFSVDIAHSRSNSALGTVSGESVRLIYGKFFQETATHVSFSANHSLGKGYKSLVDHAAMNRALDASMTGWLPNNSGVRTQANVYVNQRIGANNRYGNFYLSASEMRYWDDARVRSISAGYSHSIGSAALNIGYSQNRNMSSAIAGGARKDNVLSLSLSIPLGRAGSSYATNSYTNVSHREAGTSVRTGLNGTLPVGSDISYSVAAGRDPVGGNSSSVYVGSSTSFGVVNGGYSNANKVSSTTLQANGSVVVHGGGINFGQSVGESFVLAQVEPPVAGVGVASYKGATTGQNGYAVVPYATPYRTNWVGLDTQGLGADVEISDNMQQVVPRRGAVVLAAFKSEVGRRVQFELKLPDGSPMPFGATIKDSDGERIGVTDPRGRALVMLDGQKNDGRVTVQWERNECRLSYNLPDKQKDENYQRVLLTCTEVEEYIPPSNSQDVQLAQGKDANAF